MVVGGGGGGRWSDRKNYIKLVYTLIYDKSCINGREMLIFVPRIFCYQHFSGKNEYQKAPVVRFDFTPTRK